MYLYIYYTHRAVHRNSLAYILNGQLIQTYNNIYYITKKWKSVHYNDIIEASGINAISNVHAKLSNSTICYNSLKLHLEFQWKLLTFY